MKVLITGGQGFLGAWTVRHLVEQGHICRILDVAPNDALLRTIAGNIGTWPELHVGDVTNFADVLGASKGCEAIVHLAGWLTTACKADPVQGAHINLGGTLNVFKAAQALRINKLIHASTIGVFGPDGGAAPRPNTFYGAFKLAAEACARAYWADFGLPSVGVRPSIVFGPGRNSGLSAAPTLACKAAAQGEAYTIPFTGISAFVYVEDVAQEIVSALEQQFVGDRIVNMFGHIAEVDDFIAAIHAAQPNARIEAAGPPLSFTPPAQDVDGRLPCRAPSDLAVAVKATVDFYRAR